MSKQKVKIIDPSQIRYTPDEGEIIQNPQGQYLIWKNNQWNVINYDSNLELNLYDLNKQIVAQLPELKNLEDYLCSIEALHKKHNNKYYMLYGKEMSYFTLFHIIDASKFGKEVLDILKEIGPIKAIDLTSAFDAVEIWLHYMDSPTCLYLFPYDTGLIEVGE